MLSLNFDSRNEDEYNISFFHTGLYNALFECKKHSTDTDAIYYKMIQHLSISAKPSEYGG